MFLSRCISRERSEDTLQRLLEKVNRVPLHEDFHFRVTNGQRAEVKRACTAKEYPCFPRPIRHKEVFFFTSVSPQQLQIFPLILLKSHLLSQSISLCDTFLLSLTYNDLITLFKCSTALNAINSRLFGNISLKSHIITSSHPWFKTYEGGIFYRPYSKV